MQRHPRVSGEIGLESQRGRGDVPSRGEAIRSFLFGRETGRPHWFTRNAESQPLLAFRDYPRICNDLRRSESLARALANLLDFQPAIEIRSPRNLSRHRQLSESKEV
jgi:hypothetical protein